MKVSQQIATLLADIFREMILHPDQMKVQAIDMTQSFTVYTCATLSDSKRIVGTMGTHFGAVKALVKAAAQKHGLTAEIDNVEEVGRPVVDQYPPFKAKDNWPKEKVKSLIERMAKAVFLNDTEIQVKIVDGPNGSSNVEILVSEAESQQLVSDMLAAFKTLVRPVGKSNHRNLLVNIVASIAHEAQPTAAHGRFAPEVRR